MYTDLFLNDAGNNFRTCFPSHYTFQDGREATALQTCLKSSACSESIHIAFVRKKSYI